ncbi:MAG TPA: PAS domain S-box protein [Ginsengibacter sp.]|nr:PAS domain S-box protein [Ginsengibacter sp.]
MGQQTMDIAARLSAIVESSDDAIISKKFDGTIISWNEAAQNIFGYTAEEAINNNIAIIIPEELYEEENEISAKVKKGERISHYETIRKTKDGNKISIALSISPIKNVNGDIIGISKIVRDISGQNEANEKQAVLAAIVDSSDDAIISKTLFGIITSWNYAASKMFGYTEAEAMGKHISIIIPPDRIDEEAMIIESIRNGKKIQHFETVRVARGGRELNISLTVSPVRNKDGKIIGASKIARDITEKIETEKQRLLYTKKLQQLNEYKDEFMAMASHELKTPLTIIKANLELLLLKMQKDANSFFVEKTLKQVNKLDNLINDLLDVSKIQSGKLELKLADFNMNILLKDIISNIQFTTLIRIILKENSSKVSAYGDQDRIGLVITNLINNAIKYAPNSKEIVIDTFKSDDVITVTIKDNGIGIPREELINIFSRFYRVPGLNSTFSGSGIGLYISSEIIRRHGGKIWAESELDKGSTFYFSIPASTNLTG